MEYYKAKSGLDEISERIARNAERLSNARSIISNVEKDLTDMESEYGQFVTDINTEATEKSEDQVWQRAKEEKDKLVAEFSALKTEATAKLTAVDNA